MQKTGSSGYLLHHGLPWLFCSLPHNATDYLCEFSLADIQNAVIRLKKLKNRKSDH